MTDHCLVLVNFPGTVQDSPCNVVVINQLSVI